MFSFYFLFRKKLNNLYRTNFFSLIVVYIYMRKNERNQWPIEFNRQSDCVLFLKAMFFLCQNEHDANDVIQETRIKIVRHLGKHDESSSLHAISTTVTTETQRYSIVGKRDNIDWKSAAKKYTFDSATVKNFGEMICIII